MTCFVTVIEMRAWFRNRDNGSASSAVEVSTAGWWRPQGCR